MDSCDEEPRKHPVPVPFCEALIKPTVPEVSLIASDNFNEHCEKKIDSFSGTEFQTYNAWRWKYMSGINKVDGGRKVKDPFNCSDTNCIIKDKYSSSETEKRKNEILYGDIDEPRKPLVPKHFPEIPKCSDLFLSSNSLDDIKSSDDDIKLTSHKEISMLKKTEKSDRDKLPDCCLGTQYDNSKNLYNIIAEQNKQIDVLQKQMEQILKLQGVKDKQIEQLLLSQEAKENKIEKLLQSAVMKEQEIEKLLTLNEKQEHHMKGLMKSQEEKEKKYAEVIEKLNNVEKKVFCSIATMTDLKMTDSCTNTDKEKECSCEKNKVNESSCLRDETVGFQGGNASLSLHSTDLPVIQEQVPTPQSSIHLDIQDFHYSSEDSESESGTVRNVCLPPKVDSNGFGQKGYTFYNNIMTQVKDIIQNSGENKSEARVCGNVLSEKNYIEEKMGSVQSFQAWEVLQRENIPPILSNETKNYFHDRFPYESENHGIKEAYSPSDVSLKINSLALKYLKQEQISQYNLKSKIPTPRHHDVTIYNVTNLSFGSARYLDSCPILPNMKGGVQHDQHFIQNTVPGQLYRRKKLVQRNTFTQGNVIDINAQNQ